MKRVLIAMDKTKKIDVTFSGDSVTHKDLKHMHRALDVQFRSYHYKLVHSKIETKEIELTGV